MSYGRTFAFVGFAVTVSGCSINKTVDPIKPAQVSQVCVLDNKDILMDDYQPEIQRQIEAKHIPTKVYVGGRPADCSHYLEYTANWQWDMAMYLTYAEFRVYDAKGLTGSAFYDARMGGGRLDKFGHTAEKIRPLIDELFGAVTVGPVLVPATADAISVEPSSDRASRLQELQQLHEKGLITDDEYAAKRKEIVGAI
jgi:Short C-terminal domain